VGADKAAENWQITSQVLGLKPDRAFSVRMRVLLGGYMRRTDGARLRSRALRVKNEAPLIRRRHTFR
jgi:hypothetical protein